MRIAVTGASGNVGGQVVSLLTAAGGDEVVGLSRRGPVPADYDDPASLRAALTGIDTLVLVTSDGEAARVLTHHAHLVSAVEQTGVGHVVALSGLDTDLASPFCYAYTNGVLEAQLSRTGCAVSVVRASLFAEFFAGFLDAARATGELRLPASDARVSLVSRADVARCLAVLARAEPTGRAHEVTGPAALSMHDVAAVAGRAWDTPVSYADVDEPTFVAQTARSGESPWWTYAYASMFASIRERRWDAVSAEVRTLTGRDPVPFDAACEFRATR
ncbi:NmrA family NAD(P)-binding protein [Mumia quercus]|uniref:NmrA family NAD(P)-binding protein n=1 Tax=Mumia quercus TaxID=2976125 RepID=UPI0021D26D92|nr:NAD(P)H-binding protein [Mumia quercus]